MLAIYVIAAYSAAARVRGIHDSLRALGYSPVSAWAEQAEGPEQLESMSDAECYAIWCDNYGALAKCDGVIVLADTPMREGWCEVSACADQRVPVVVVGPPNLTTRAMAWDHVATDALAVSRIDALLWRGDE